MHQLDTRTVLQEAADCFASARANVFGGMRLLHAIYSQELWKEKHESFRDFVLRDCDIKYAFAMRLVGNWNRYIIEGKIDPKKLEGIDADRLYLAARTSGTPEEQLSRALVLSRAELRIEIVDEDGTCEHTETCKICVNCGRKV